MSGISGISSSVSSLYSQSMKRPDPSEMFKKIDTDGNGGISQDEVNAMASDMSSKSGQSIDLSSAITTYDTNGDSLLSQDEMGTMMMALKETLGPPPGANAGTSASEASSAYQANSGMSAPLPGPPPSGPPPQADSSSSSSSSSTSSTQNGFNSLDTNGDGVVSQDELQAALSDLTSMTGQDINVEDAISSFDEDGDGSLNKTEMDSMMSSMAPPPPPENSAQNQASSNYLANSGNADLQNTLLSLLHQNGSVASNYTATDTTA